MVVGGSQQETLMTWVSCYLGLVSKVVLNFFILKHYQPTSKSELSIQSQDSSTVWGGNLAKIQVFNNICLRKILRIHWPDIINNNLL
ncbi:unnamed protein product [Schistosoma margrebowiei]|uniref:Uncharacterized protein n=1 Tax=Schistosoma margrebowiei TaxID=48269 RepID=A0A183MX76_9TREM|nr:unnamed protein product [Schistosoma margrebowiei]